METPAQMGARLVAALEDLARQEAACVQNRDFAAVVEIQDRAAPLVENLVEHADAITEPGLRERIRALLAQRHETGAWLTAEIERTRQEIHALDATHRRAGKVAPAYGSSAPAASRRLSAVG